MIFGPFTEHTEDNFYITIGYMGCKKKENLHCLLITGQYILCIVTLSIPEKALEKIVQFTHGTCFSIDVLLGLGTFGHW